MMGLNDLPKQIYNLQLKRLNKINLNSKIKIDLKIQQDNIKYTITLNKQFSNNLSREIEFNKIINNDKHILMLIIEIDLNNYDINKLTYKIQYYQNILLTLNHLDMEVSE